MSDPVQVQLVGAWWEQIIPAIALLLSLFSVALTLLFRYADRLRLRVAMSTVMIIGSDVTTDRLAVSVTNTSRTATTQVINLTLSLKGGESFAYVDPWPGDSKLPINLLPGESAQHSYPYAGLAEAIRSRPDQVRWLRPTATSGHKRVHGRKDRKLPSALVSR